MFHNIRHKDANFNKKIIKLLIIFINDNYQEKTVIIKIELYFLVM